MTIGTKINKLTILKQSEPYRWKNTVRKMWLCVCDCGKERIVSGTKLRTNSVTQCKSCGYASRKQSQRRFSVYERLFNLYILGRARKRKIPVSLSVSDYEKICGMDCHYCGKHPELIEVYKNKYSKSETKYRQGVDRIDSSLGYSKLNTVPCCKFCNFAKSTLTVKQFIDNITRVYEHTKLRS